MRTNLQRRLERLLTRLPQLLQEACAEPAYQALGFWDRRRKLRAHDWTE